MEILFISLFLAALVAVMLIVWWLLGRLFRLSDRGLSFGRLFKQALKEQDTEDRER